MPTGNLPGGTFGTADYSFDADQLRVRITEPGQGCQYLRNKSIDGAQCLTALFFGYSGLIRGLLEPTLTFLLSAGFSKAICIRHILSLLLDSIPLNYSTEDHCA